MALPRGTRLGPYEVSESIGAGGMGEVYRARDTRLERTVAIKVLPPELADSEFKDRFAREANAASSLNHPHICTLHDIGHQDGVDYLVMEYLEGESLARRLEKGPLPLEQALCHGIEIADALATAHRQRLVHRDLKPSNIMLTRTGAKLLDFGLAKKTLPAGTAPGGPTASVKLETPVTAPGSLIGTYQYMAPEQFEGREADVRSDIFAFGSVLYEMVTGRPAFEGSSRASVMAKIMEHDPAPLSSLRPATPPALDRLVRVCLNKNPDGRPQAADDVLLNLKWILEDSSHPGAPPEVVAESRTPRLPSRMLLFVPVVLLLASLAINVRHFRESVEPARVMRFPLLLPDGVSQAATDAPVLSPDGRHLVFSAMTGTKRQLWVRSLDTTAIRPLPGTEDAYYPFWSPDSREVGFYAEGEKLKRVSLSGGSAQTLCATPPRLNNPGATWSPEGVIVFGDGTVLSRVPANGGQSQPATTLDQNRRETMHQSPCFLPDGKHFVYLARSREQDNQAIFVGSLDGTTREMVLKLASPALYSPAGYLVYMGDRMLMAAPFDWNKRRLTGEPFPVADAVTRSVGGLPPKFSVSESGALVYRQDITAEKSRLTWYGRDGKKEGVVGEPGSYGQLALSPDGTRLVVERQDPKDNAYHLWLLELSTGILSRLTYAGVQERDAVWSPDSRRIVYSTNRAGIYDLYQKVIGSEKESLVLESNADKVPEAWTPDGRSILYMSRQGTSITELPLLGEPKPRLLLDTAYTKDEPHLSPDSRWVAYNSRESGQWEVNIASFPGFTEKRQVSVQGGGEARWRKDGRELYYLDLQGTIMAVDVTPLATGIQTSTPRPLFRTNVVVNTYLDQYEVTADGKRFLVIEPYEVTPPTFQLILNWTALQPR